MGWFIALAIILMIVVGIFSYLAEKKRTEEMAVLAKLLGLRFRTSADHDHDDEYGHFELFRQGHSRTATNTLTGSIDVGGHPHRVKAGDFRYKVTSGSGKDRRTTTYHFSYLILHLRFQTPDLLIRKEGVFDKLAGAFGFDDIDFESEEFSRAFCVKSDDKKFAYDVIHAEMMEFLLKGLPAAIDIEHGRLLLADGRRRWQPSMFRSRFRYVDEFLSRWPDHLTRTLAGADDSRQEGRTHAD